jgi:hypothetical protein
METACEAALVVWTLVMFNEGRVYPTGFLLGLSILARPDAALLGVLLLSVDWKFGRRNGWKIALSAILVTLPWQIFAMTTFGSILPSTLAAKIAQSSLVWWKMAMPFILATLWYDPWTYPAAAVVVAGIVVAAKQRRLSLGGPTLLVVYGLAHALAYTAIRAPIGYCWYYVPMQISLAVGCVCAIRSQGAVLVDWMFPRAWVRSKSYVLKGAPYVLIGSLAVGTLLQPSVYRLGAEYRAVASFLRSRDNGQAAVASAEIGYIGFFSGRRVLDVHGLIHPEAHAEIAEGTANWWLKRSPGFVVVHTPPWYGEPGYQADFLDSFKQRYRRVFEIPAGTEQTVAVWERTESGNPLGKVTPSINVLERPQTGVQAQAQP